ncbi:Dyp-type peroxidase [Actinocorallia herbida]|nr:Dyp-type peroxidase [Actinocorallia herbida]
MDAQPMAGPLTSAAVFLVFTLEPGGEETARDLLRDLDGLRRAIGFRAASGGLTCVAGIGSDAWDRLYGGKRPALLHPFQELRGPAHTAPATPGDLLFHLRAERQDLCFELARQIHHRLGAHVTLADETHGFRYFDRRDLLGFVDGTENPEGEDAVAAATVGAEDPEFAGGGYAVVQKYLHDLESWNALPVEAQERAIGRTKLDDIELDDKPADAHLSLNVITDEDGEELEVVRYGMPFGGAANGAGGLYYLAYARDPRILERMLRNMFLGDGAAEHDRILDFSTAITGGLFFIPPAGLLESTDPAP